MPLPAPTWWFSPGAYCRRIHHSPKATERRLRALGPDALRAPTSFYLPYPVKHEASEGTSVPRRSREPSGHHHEKVSARAR